jgi:hypothetical protein
MRKWDGCKEPSLLFKPSKKQKVMAAPVKKKKKPARSMEEDWITDDDVPF